MNILLNSFKKLYFGALDTLIAPPFCAYCKKYLSTRAIFCDTCDARMSPIVSTHLKVNRSYTMTVIAIADYQEPLKSLVIAKAWGDILASYHLGDLLLQKSYFKEVPCDYVIPVPLHWMRYAKRGYNQAEVIAGVLAKEKKCVVANIVKRSRRTPFQSSLAYDKRTPNVQNAFQLITENPHQFHNKHLIIVDDLMTTGATLQAIARELAVLQPASINAVVAAKVL